MTMADVAARLGVHQATVSRALTRPDAVRPATRDRILDAVEALGYVPNAGARRLAGGSTGVVAVMVPDLANPFFARLLKALQRALTDSGSHMLVADTDLDPMSELELVRTFAPNVDAVVLCSPVASTQKLQEVAAERALVFVNRSATRVPSVSIDQKAIVEIGVDHLRQLGHRRIGVALGPSEYWSSAQRKKAATDLPGVTVFDDIAPTFAGGAAVFERLLSSGVSGVVAFNDLMALGMISAAAASGCTVPGRLSVVGSDDNPDAAMATPALTTVAAPLEALAGEVVGAFLRASRDDMLKHPRRLLPVELVCRASTGPPLEGR